MSLPEKGRITPHIHCKTCGKAIPPNRDFCSNECRATDLKTQKRAKTMTRIYTLSFVVLMVLLILFSLVGRPP